MYKDKVDRHFRMGVTISVLLIVVQVIAVVAIAVFVVTSPEAIGAFFGRIVDGFKGVVQ